MTPGLISGELEATLIRVASSDLHRPCWHAPVVWRKTEQACFCHACVSHRATSKHGSYCRPPANYNQLYRSFLSPGLAFSFPVPLQLRRQAPKGGHDDRSCMRKARGLVGQSRQRRVAGSSVARNDMTSCLQRLKTTASTSTPE